MTEDREGATKLYRALTDLRITPKTSEFGNVLESLVDKALAERDATIARQAELTEKMAEALEDIWKTCRCNDFESAVHNTINIAKEALTLYKKSKEKP